MVNPSMMINIPPTAVNQYLCVSITEVISETEKTASEANMVSAVAAPSPETKPESWVPLSVRCTHIIPIGPSGIEARKPTIIPSMRSVMGSMSISLVE